MKQLLLIVATCLILFTSCKTINFETPQPKNAASLTEFPVNIQGKYKDKDKKDKDTLVITAKSFTLGKKNSYFPNEAYINSDTVVLKKLNDYYILNLGDRKTWSVILFKQKDKTLISYFIKIDDKNEATQLNLLKQITPFTPVKGEDGNINSYKINPTPEEFQQLIDKGMFTEMTTFKKIK